MGTHGRIGVKRYLLGSITEKVVRLSDVPVLTVKAEDDGEVTSSYADILAPTDGSEGAEARRSPDPPYPGFGNRHLILGRCEYSSIPTGLAINE